MDLINAVLPTLLILTFVGLVILANILVPETTNYHTLTCKDA